MGSRGSHKFSFASDTSATTSNNADAATRRHIIFRLRPWRCAAVLIGCFSYLYQTLRENYHIHNGACYDI